MFLHADVALPMVTTETLWYSNILLHFVTTRATKSENYISHLWGRLFFLKTPPRKITCVIVAFDAIVQLCIVWQFDPNSLNFALGNNGRWEEGAPGERLATPLLWLRCNVLCSVLLCATLCCGSGYGNGSEEVSPCQRGRKRGQPDASSR